MKIFNTNFFIHFVPLVVFGISGVVVPDATASIIYFIGMFVCAVSYMIGEHIDTIHEANMELIDETYKKLDSYADRCYNCEPEDYEDALMDYEITKKVQLSFLSTRI